MVIKPLILSISCLTIALAGCSRSKAPEAGRATVPPNPRTATTDAESSKGKIDACALLTSKEIESIQGEPAQQTKASGKPDGEMAVSQCYFALPTSSNSISLAVIQKGDGSSGRDPKAFWEETFHREHEQEKGSEGEKEKGQPPQKIDGVGDEAFWSGDRVGGVLYVLKGDSYIRISVGGADNQATKIEKSKALAEIVLKRI